MSTSYCYKCGALQPTENVARSVFHSPDLRPLLELATLWPLPDNDPKKIEAWRRFCPTAPMTPDNLLHAIYNVALPLHMTAQDRMQSRGTDKWWRDTQ